MKKGVQIISGIVVLILLSIVIYIYSTKNVVLMSNINNTKVKCGNANPGNSCSDGVCGEGYSCNSFGYYCGCVNESANCGGSGNFDGCNGNCPSGNICIGKGVATGPNSFDWSCSCQNVSGEACGKTAPTCGGKCPGGQVCTAAEIQGVIICGCTLDIAQRCDKVKPDYANGVYCSGVGSCPKDDDRCEQMGSSCRCFEKPTGGRGDIAEILPFLIKT